MWLNVDYEGSVCLKGKARQDGKLHYDLFFNQETHIPILIALNVQVNLNVRHTWTYCTLNQCKVAGS